MLPADAENWSDSALRRALVHELEHVRRADWLIQNFARLVCAFYWFHPLVWMAWRKLLLEAERSCDDAVLVNSERVDYAEQLILLARRLSFARATPLLSMANRSDLSTRVSAILNTHQRRGPVSGFATCTLLVLAGALVLGLAPVRAVGISRKNDSPQEQSKSRPDLRALDRALLESAESGDIESVLKLLDSGANVNAAINGDGSPLIVAASEGHKAVVQLLLDRGADPNLGVEGDGSALIAAAREGHLEIITLLLDRGANMNLVVPGDENPLIQASAEGELEAVKLLVSRGANVNARVAVTVYGRQTTAEVRTPLSMARKGGHKAVVDFLISAGARD
jgi:hypothetical protein